MKSRPKQSICEQIATMKSNGVKFGLITENEAARYLEYNTYFFKELSDNRKENRKITSYVVKIPGISRDMRRTMMKHRVIHDFATLLYIIDTAIDSPGIKSHLIESLDQLVNERMIRHKDYFTKNNTLLE